MNEKRKPIASLKGYGAYAVQVAVWSSEKGYTITAQKRFKDKDGEYKETKTLFANEAVAMAHLLLDAVRIGDAYLDKGRSVGKDQIEIDPLVAKVVGSFQSSGDSFDDDDILF